MCVGKVKGGFFTRGRDRSGSLRDEKDLERKGRGEDSRLRQREGEWDA